MTGDQMGGDYQTDNHVTGYDENPALAWQTAAVGTEPPGWEWTWELKPQGPDATEVTLTYDWSKVTDKAILEKVTFPPGATRWSRGLPEQVGRRRLVLIMRRCLTLRTYAAHAGARRRSGRSRVVRAFPWGACGPVRMLTGLVISPGRPRG